MIKGNGQSKIFIVGIWVYGIIYFFLIMQMYPLHTPSEELGALSMAATLAGCDWREVVRNDCSYYGIGFYSICTVLFRVFKNPIVIYRCIIGINALGRLGISMLSYIIGKKYFYIENNRMLAIVSFIVPLMQISRISRGAHNDLIIDVLIWVIVLLICKLIYSNTTRSRLINSIVLVFISMFGLTVHTRWVVVLPALAIALLFGEIIGHKNYVSYIVVPFSVGIYIVTTKLIEIVKKEIWMTDGYIANGQVSMSKGIDYLSINTWKLWLDMVLGNLSTAVIISGGLVVFTVTILGYFYVYKAKNKQISNFDLYIFIISLFLIICICATLVGLLVSEWATSMYDGYVAKEYGNNIYAFKGMTYVRYWGAYISPLILCAIAVAEKYKFWKKIKDWSICINIFGIVVFLSRIFPYIQNHKDALINSFIGISGITYEIRKTIKEYYLISIIISLIIIILYYLLVSKNNVLMAMLLMLFFYTCQMISANLNYDIPQQKSFYQTVDQVIDYYYNLDQDHRPTKIYVIEQDEKKNNNLRQSVMIQFYLFDQKIYSQIPDEFQAGEAVIAREDISGILEGYKFEKITLSDNEIWYWIK